MIWIISLPIRFELYDSYCESYDFDDYDVMCKICIIKSQSLTIHRSSPKMKSTWEISTVGVASLATYIFWSNVDMESSVFCSGFSVCISSATDSLTCSAICVYFPSWGVPFLIWDRQTFAWVPKHNNCAESHVRRHFNKYS